MKYLNRISCLLRQFIYERKALLTIPIISFIFSSSYMSEMAKKMEVLPLDLYITGYSVKEGYSFLESLGSDGTVAYTKALYGDFVYIGSYAFFASFMISLAIIFWPILDVKKWGCLNLLPFVVAFLDLGENFCLLSIIKLEDVSESVMIVANIFTICKWVVAIPTLSILLASIIIVVRHAMLVVRSGR